MLSLIRTSSACLSDDLLIVRMTGFATGSATGLAAGVVAAGLGGLMGRGFIVLNIVGWAGGAAAGLLAVGKGVGAVCGCFANWLALVTAGGVCFSAGRWLLAGAGLSAAGNLFAGVESADLVAAVIAVLAKVEAAAVVFFASAGVVALETR